MIGLFCTLSFGQVKQITPPVITSPFKTKTEKNQKNGKVITPTTQAVPTSQKRVENVKTPKGSFFLDFRTNNNLSSRPSESRTANVVSREFGAWFGLNEDHTFQLISEKEDELKISHSYYQQYYKGFLVEGSVLMLHSRNGEVYASNGQVGEFETMELKEVVSKTEALKIAKDFLAVVQTSADYPVETLICRIPKAVGFDFKFVQKVRIDASNPFVMCNVYVDAQTGQVVNKISLIAHANSIESQNTKRANKENIRAEVPKTQTAFQPSSDVTATAITLYSGTQTITTDFSNGIYTLKDNARKIETYDGTLFSVEPKIDPVLFSNTTTNWGQLPKLDSFSIQTVSQNWWYALFVDTKPDLYIKVKDEKGNIVHDGSKFYFEVDRLPSVSSPVTFSLDIPMTSQFYTVEIWDYDDIGGDDFGGSFIISSSSGAWSGNGNKGVYTISPGVSNPGTDIHWGMEKTFDFYKNTLNRNSFDNAGARIRNVYNLGGKNPTNASANQPVPVQANDCFMEYGKGDGKTMNPVVCLDVQGHEFTHLVVAYNGFEGLAYQGESGALNESFADIFGTAIEFYTKPATTGKWTIGEDFMLPVGNIMRSMEKPKLKEHPNTYGGDFWIDPSDSYDFGGVHENSGVQNYWFYLLSEGGADKNDKGNTYNVSGIGIEKASKIAYINLTTYLASKKSTYKNSYDGSLLAAEALYGNPSAEYTAVQNAWYAVGIGTDPNLACSGTTNLTDISGTITDGSNTANYINNADCKWVIAPAGATQISLDFTAFDTEDTHDKVMVYDGPDENSALLAEWWGNTLPQTITTTAGVGAMCIKFVTNASVAYSGWTATYEASGTAPSCEGISVLTAPSGSIEDGSGTDNYVSNQKCAWYIAPPCATAVTVSFSEFDTEADYDGLVIYDGLDLKNKLGQYSGTNLPATITSNTGTMVIAFMSDYANNQAGFKLNYSSSAVPDYAYGSSILNQDDSGVISDGSADKNYCNNTNYTWLIQPPQATNIALKFTDFELEASSSDGKSYYDFVEVYDGNSETAPLLGRFTGNTIPPMITSTGGSLFVSFRTDYDNAYKGWSAEYTSSQKSYCDNGITTLTASSGSFDDGSGTNLYTNNADCNWLIQPTNANSISLSFTSFDTEKDIDGVVVYDGATNTSPVLGVFTGNTLPNTVTSTGGSMLVRFISDVSRRSGGWAANYTSTNPSNPTTFNLDRKLIDSAGNTQTSGSTIITWSLGESVIGNMDSGNVKFTNGFHPLLNAQTLDIQDNSIDLSVVISPNPTNDFLNIHQKQNHGLKVSVLDISGKYIMEETFNYQDNKMDVSKLPQGVYIIYVQDKQTQKTNTYKIIKN